MNWTGSQHWGATVPTSHGGRWQEWERSNRDANVGTVLNSAFSIKAKKPKPSKGNLWSQINIHYIISMVSLFILFGLICVVSREKMILTSLSILKWLLFIKQWFIFSLAGIYCSSGDHQLHWDFKRLSFIVWMSCVKSAHRKVLVECRFLK